ncbi:MAG: MBL fold metallo-hydrolase [Oscillospiraceae bacterium]|nr:MBL fold metallo-hydrolase [Oscillospiraceae bacterium]
MAKRSHRAKSGRIPLIISVLVLIASLCYAVFTGTIPLEEWLSPPPETSKSISAGYLNQDADVAVHFIDVGQGDSVYIKAYGRNILIDAGEKETERTDVVEYLSSLGVKRLDYVIGSHPHSDHIGGLQAVIEAFEIGTVIMPRIPDEIVPTTATYRNLLGAIEKKGLKIKAAQDCGEIILAEGKDAKLTFLGPTKDYDNLNSMSVCVKFSAKGYSALFCGDAEKDAEKEMLKQKDALRCSILKLSHHGSSTSSTQKFLDAVSPDCFVICVGANNSYNHPTTSVLGRIEKFEKPVYRTDLNGSIVFEFEDESIKVITER